MASNNTLLCIHRDPGQLNLLQENGFELVTATSGSDGLRLFGLRPVDAIVLDYQLGLLDGGVVAAEIKKVKPQVPIVMLAEDVDLPEDALNAVDAIVAKADGPEFLLATVRSVLNVNPAQRDEELKSQTPTPLPRPGRSPDAADPRQGNTAQSATDEKGAPFSPGVWRGIRNGTVQF